MLEITNLIKNKFLIFQWEILSIVLCSSILTTWNAIVSGAFHPEVLLFFLIFCYICWITGVIITDLFPGTIKNVSDFNINFLTGFFFINSFVYLLQFILPLSVYLEMVLLTSVLIIMAALKALLIKPHLSSNTDKKSQLPAFLTLLIVFTASSFWAQTSLFPVQNMGNVTIIRPWLDCFSQAHLISAFSISHGYGTLNSMYLAGKHISYDIPFYHYANYISSAALISLTATTSLQAYNSFLTPFGFILTGLSAYALIKCFWGPWAGLSSCLTLFLIPDASQILINNHWLSYYWMQLISPSSLYGTSIMALAWLFMVLGCSKGRISLVIISFIISLISMNYKFHIFIANSLILLLYPALFFKKLPAKVRIIWFSSALALFFFTLSVIQKIKIGPVIKLDGSAIHPYTSLVISMFESEQLKNFFSHSFGINSPFKDILWICFMAFMLFICTLGLFGISYLVLLYIERKKIKQPILILPLAFIINYLIMSLFLAYNTPVSSPNGMGTSEELLHRPFVWVYYLVNIWVGGAIYYHFKDYFSHLNKIQKSIVSLIATILFIVPFEFGMTVQQGPKSLQYYANNPVPTGLINSCEFIKKHSDILSIVQDSENDSNGYVTCLSERQAFVMKYYNVVRGPDQIERLKIMDHLKLMTNKNDIKYILAGDKISWYILHPEDQVYWPKDLLNKSVYNSYGYRVFSLKDSFN